MTYEKMKCLCDFLCIQEQEARFSLLELLEDAQKTPMDKYYKFYLSFSSSDLYEKDGFFFFCGSLTLHSSDIPYGENKKSHRARFIYGLTKYTTRCTILTR